jgi:hypothetical protein
MERAIGQEAAGALLDVAAVAALCSARRIALPYQRTDMARNTAARILMTQGKSDEDVLVMLDADHTHPRDIVRRLATQVDAEHEVVGALAFRRSEPHDPCAYTFGADGVTVDVRTTFSGGLERCDIVGTGAVAIRRSAFRKLAEAGKAWPWFRYTYQEGIENKLQRSEDWQFGLDCREVGIPHWVDTGYITPHLTTHEITDADWTAQLERIANDPAAAESKYNLLGMTFAKA